MHLSERDLELLQEAVLELHEPRDVAGLREVAPAVLKRVIPSDYFTWFESARGHFEDFLHPGNVWESPRRTTPQVLRNMVALVDQHPFARHIVETGDPGPLRISDFWTRREQLASVLHREVWRHVGIGRFLAMAVVRGNRTGMISLARPLAARDFSERDRHMFKLLVPHFLLALTSAELSTAREAAALDVMDSLGLTRRETEVATWLARGRTNSEIASILAMKPRTVEKHVENILVKLGVENRTAAARVVMGMATVGPLTATLPDPDGARERIANLLRSVQRPARGQAGDGARP